MSNKFHKTDPFQKLYSIWVKLSRASGETPAPHEQKDMDRVARAIVNARDDWNWRMKGLGEALTRADEATSVTDVVVAPEVSTWVEKPELPLEEMGRQALFDDYMKNLKFYLRNLNNVELSMAQGDEVKAIGMLASAQSKELRRRQQLDGETLARAWRAGE